MKIQESHVQLSASREASRSHTLEITTEQSFRQVFAEVALDADDEQLAARQKIRKLLQSLIEAIMAAMDGKKFGENFAVCEPEERRSETTRAVAAGPEIRWQRSIRECVSESEETTVCGAGKVTTCDGRVIEFDYGLKMARSFASEKRENDSGTINLSDPLMLSFNGAACELTQACINFDLDADGKAEQIPGMGEGTGFLVFDRNGNGKADDGKELFGVASGNGFADLAALDSDHNGWIDEGDPAFSRLGVWSNEGFASLAARGVGALSTSTVNAEFSLKTKSNELLGQIRAAGLYLTEAGQVGHLQQVDLAVSDLPDGPEHPEQRQQLAA